MRHIYRTKNQGEIIPVKINMLGRCLDGETIALAEVSVSVISGEDPAPNDMLVGTASVGDGEWVTQTIEGGVLGVVYDLVFSVTTSLDNIYIDTVPLAIVSELP